MEETENLTHAWLKEGWNSYLDNFRQILPAVIAFHILATLPMLLIWKYFDNRWYAIPYELFIGAPLTIGMNLFFIGIARGGKAEYGDIFKGFFAFVNVIAVSIIFGIIVTGGFMMFIVPGLIWGVMYGFSQYAVLDRKTGIKESFVYSAAITYGFKDRLFFIFMLWAMIEVFTPGVIGARGGLMHPRLALDFKPWVIMAFVLKTFVFLPWLDMTMAKAYVWLVKNHEAGGNKREP
ncbi:MAG: hypothetical protein KKH28_01725 [Elusimicrobia bacterium]|nr:hypothetical protein [Elusimicrobiota bacterium]